MKPFWPPLIAAAGFVSFVLIGFLDVNTSALSENLRFILATSSFAMIVVGLAAAIFSRKFHVLVRSLSALLLLFVLGLCFVSYSYGVSLRNAALTVGKNDLKQAMLHYEQHGHPTNFSSNSEIWRSSNVVTVAGSTYECFLTVRSDRFNGDGLLAMTTNRVFIWIDTKHGPKVIDANYRPPFFPPTF